VPHQCTAYIYDTNLRLTDFISESSNTTLRDELNDMNHSDVMATIGDLKRVYDFGCKAHQGCKKEALIEKWSKENLSPEQYMYVIGSELPKEVDLYAYESDEDSE
jgi:hypothetical protein